MKNELQKTPSNSSRAVSVKQNKLIGDWIQNEVEYEVAKTFDGKRIGDYTKEDMTKLVELMAHWRVLLGVTSDSTEIELVVICQFVYDNFKKYSLADIRLAMNWAISGRIDVGFVSQKSLSSFYVSKVLNAYDDRKRDIYNGFMERRDRHLQRLEIDKKSEPTVEEKAKLFKEMLMGLYTSHQNNQPFYDFNDFVYNWLKSTGQIQATQEEINAAVFYGQEKYRDERRQQNAANILRQISNMDVGDNKEEKQKKYAREYIIKKYFDKYTIGEIISKIKPSQF
jgi:succinate dehydrogenase flavin-adding protein (antitoxin of CptAB toxin-antitoxin module)